MHEFIMENNYKHIHTMHDEDEDIGKHAADSWAEKKQVWRRTDRGDVWTVAKSKWWQRNCWSPKIYQSLSPKSVTDKKNYKKECSMCLIKSKTYGVDGGVDLFKAGA